MARKNKAQKKVSSVMREYGPRKQAIAIALSEAERTKRKPRRKPR